MNNYSEYFKLYDKLWEEMYQVKKYIDKNKERPPTHNKDPEIKKLGYRISNQQNNYDKKIKSVNNVERYKNGVNL